MFTVWPVKYLLDFFTSNWAPDVQDLSEIGNKGRWPTKHTCYTDCRVREMFGFFFLNHSSHDLGGRGEK